MGTLTKERIENLRKMNELFKKYKPYTLRLPGGSSITMDNKESMIKLCKERGIPFDPATYNTKEKGNKDGIEESESTASVIEEKETIEIKKEVVPKTKKPSVSRKGHTKK